MLFFVDIYVDPKDLTIEELWDLWAKEAQAAAAVPEGLVVGMWKVVGQRRVIGVMNAESNAQIDRIIMAGLPMSHHLEINEITPIRDYADFAKDVINRWK
jgi:muconolactone delta-isomerase